MTDLRDNLVWVVGSIATGIAVAIGWFVSSGVAVNILFVLIGSGITYFVQTRTQKKAWKREYSVKMAEEIYGVLFKEMKIILERLEKHYTWWIGFDKWREFQEDHRYYMVDVPLRNMLDGFRERIERYGNAFAKLRKGILKFAIEEIDRVLGVKVNETPKFNVTFKRGYTRVSTSAEFIDCLFSKIQPTDHATRDESEISDVECIVELKSLEGKTTHIPYAGEFEEVWKSCLKRMTEDDTYKFVVKENTSLIEDVKAVRKELIKRVEETWKL